MVCKVKGRQQLHPTVSSASFCLDDPAAEGAKLSLFHNTDLCATTPATPCHKPRSLCPPKQRFSQTWVCVETEFY